MAIKLRQYQGLVIAATVIAPTATVPRIFLPETQTPKPAIGQMTEVFRPVTVIAPTYVQPPVTSEHAIYSPRPLSLTQLVGPVPFWLYQGAATEHKTPTPVPNVREMTQVSIPATVIAPNFIRSEATEPKTPPPYYRVGPAEFNPPPVIAPGFIRSSASEPAMPALYYRVGPAEFIPPPVIAPNYIRSEIIAPGTSRFTPRELSGIVTPGAFQLFSGRVSDHILPRRSVRPLTDTFAPVTFLSSAVIIQPPSVNDALGFKPQGPRQSFIVDPATVIAATMAGGVADTVLPQLRTIQYQSMIRPATVLTVTTIIQPPTVSDPTGFRIARVVNSTGAIGEIFKPTPFQLFVGEVPAHITGAKGLLRQTSEVISPAVFFPAIIRPPVVSDAQISRQTVTALTEISRPPFSVLAISSPEVSAFLPQRRTFIHPDSFVLGQVIVFPVIQPPAIIVPSIERLKARQPDYGNYANRSLLFTVLQPPTIIDAQSYNSKPKQFFSPSDGAVSVFITQIQRLIIVSKVGSGDLIKVTSSGDVVRVTGSPDVVKKSGGVA